MIRLALLPLLIVPALAEDLTWPGWMGPDRNGWVEHFDVPEQWPEKLRQVWRAEVGTGYGTPLIAGDRIYQHARQGDEEVVWSLDLATGKKVWRKSYPVSFTMGRGGNRHGKGPKSSPILADGRLFTLSITGILSAWDTDTGDLLWRRDFVKRFEEPSPYWGTSTSPIVDGERLFVHLGSCESGALLCLDTRTGKDIWTQDKHGHCYSSPLILELAGVRQLVEWNHFGLSGVDLGTGKILWEFPFPHHGNNQNTPTPVAYKGTILAGGENKGMRCVQPRLADGKWTVSELWNTREISLDMSTAVINGDHLFGMSHFKTGQYFCLDPRTGKVRWKGPPRLGENVMFVSVPGHVLAMVNHGQLQVLKASPEALEVVRTYRVADDGTWAPPVLLKDRVLTKDRAHLTMWSLPN